MSKKKKVEIAPFQVLDKQIFADTQRVMYYIDYTDADREGPDWKYRVDIEAEYGEAVKQIVKSFNLKFKEEQKDLHQMWSVKSIQDKRFNSRTQQTEYQVLWDTQNDEMSWESVENLDTCQASIAEFESRRLSCAKRKLSALDKTSLVNPSSF